MKSLKDIELQKKRIMIVDDDETSLAIATAMLEDDYEVVAAKSGLQALGRLQEEKMPNLILLDMVMPGTSGMDVLKAIKSTPRLAEIPVVFLTSMEDVDFKLEGFTNGADDFLQKPIHAELMKMKIRRQLYLFQLRQENQILQEKLQTIRSKIDKVFDEIM